MFDREEKNRLLGELSKLFQVRKQLVLQEDEDAAKFGGDEIYQRAVEQICELMLEIKIKFPHRVSNIPFFDKVEDPVWREIFARNFHKISIDRQSYTAYDAVEGYKHYNRFKEEGFGNLCYGEGFACAFLSMLEMVYDRFSAEIELEKPSRISNGEIIEMMTKFCQISLVESDERKDEEWEVCGSDASYPEVLRRWQIQKKHGTMTAMYDLENTAVRNIFSHDFNHQTCIAEFYEIYQRELLSGKDFDQETAKFVEVLSSATHLFADGNGRSAILLGWFLSMMNNSTYPILLNPYCSDGILQEAREWTAQFARDPEIHPASDGKMILLSKERDRARSEIVEREVMMCFMDSLFTNERLEKGVKGFYFRVPFKLETDLALVEDLELSDGDYLVVPCHLLESARIRCDEENILVRFSPALVVEAVNSMPEELLSEKDLQIRNARIAIAVARKAMAKDDAITEEDCTALEYLIRSYFLSDVLKSINHSKEFEKFAHWYIRKDSFETQESLSSILSQEQCEALGIEKVEIDSSLEEELEDEEEESESESRSGEKRKKTINEEDSVGETNLKYPKVSRLNENPLNKGRN
jgi:hypothetical protein